jgi:hypothetical protein
MPQPNTTPPVAMTVPHAHSGAMRDAGCHTGDDVNVDQGARSQHPQQIVKLAMQYSI